MIYIVEIPHQRKPFCRSAHDEEDAVIMLWQHASEKNNPPKVDAPFAEWARYNAQDLHSQYVFMDAASAIAGLKEIGGHGAVEAITALREELEDTCELPEEGGYE